MKNHMIQISSYCRIQRNKVFVDNGSVFDFDGKAYFSDFIRACYKDIGCDYPRFYKMDNLCKLGYIAAEYLMGRNPITDRYEKEKIGMMILNSNSSLYSDSKFYQGITSKDNYYPEPAVFVYTLPNIVISEICIRFGIKGENQFFISGKPACEFDFDFVSDYVGNLIRENRADACIVGWVDMDADENYESFLCLVEENRDSDNLDVNIFNKESLYKIYTMGE